MVPSNDIFCVAQQLDSGIKGHHVYGYKYTVNEELTYTIDDDNKHRSNVIKVLFRDVEKKKNKRNVTKEQPVGHVPEPLAKILYPMMKEWRIRILSVKALITRNKRRAREATWFPGGGIELPYIYHIYAAKTHKKYVCEKLKKQRKKN